MSARILRHLGPDFETLRRQVEEATAAWVIAIEKMLAAFQDVADGMAKYVAAVRAGVKK